MPTLPDLAVEAAYFIVYELMESWLRCFYMSTINYDPFENWKPFLANFPIFRPAFYGLCLAGILPTCLFTIVNVYLFLADIFVGDIIHSVAESVARRPLVRNTVGIASRFLPKSLYKL
ncbi:hypothetical protein DSO57_1010999 [Entomophthora muscae]|nr:hypothetical protein DSO57_1010999 [Entomophthora muscae]